MSLHNRCRIMTPFVTLFENTISSLCCVGVIFLCMEEQIEWKIILSWSHAKHLDQSPWIINIPTSCNYMVVIKMKHIYGNSIITYVLKNLLTWSRYNNTKQYQNISNAFYFDILSQIYDLDVWWCKVFI